MRSSQRFCSALTRMKAPIKATVRSHEVILPNFNWRVSNPRNTAYVQFQLSYESSNLRGAAPICQCVLLKTACTPVVRTAILLRNHGAFSAACSNALSVVLSNGCSLFSGCMSRGIVTFPWDRHWTCQRHSPVDVHFCKLRRAPFCTRNEQFPDQPDPDPYIHKQNSATRLEEAVARTSSSEAFKSRLRCFGGRSREAGCAMYLCIYIYI